ncbi:MAG: hypothetical protein WCV73_01810 [Patescibacteria group bacterium]|jgi:uncharacterized membrane protein
MSQTINISQPVGNENYYASKKRKIIDFLIGLFSNFLSIPLFTFLVLLLGTASNIDIFDQHLHDWVGLEEKSFIFITTILITLATLLTEYLIIKKLNKKRKYITKGMIIPLVLLILIMLYALLYTKIKGFNYM